MSIRNNRIYISINIYYLFFLIFMSFFVTGVLIFSVMNYYSNSQLSVLTVVLEKALSDSSLLCEKIKLLEQNLGILEASRQGQGFSGFPTRVPPLNARWTGLGLFIATASLFFIVMYPAAFSSYANFFLFPVYKPKGYIYRFDSPDVLFEGTYFRGKQFPNGGVFRTYPDNKCDWLNQFSLDVQFKNGGPSFLDALPSSDIVSVLEAQQRMLDKQAAILESLKDRIDFFSAAPDQMLNQHFDLCIKIFDAVEAHALAGALTNAEMRILMDAYRIASEHVTTLF